MITTAGHIDDMGMEQRNARMSSVFAMQCTCAVEVGNSARGLLRQDLAMSSAAAVPLSYYYYRYE